MIPLDEQARLLSAVQPLLENGLVDGIRISTRPDGLGDDILRFLSGYSVKTVEVGVQSLDDEVLRLSGRGHMAADSISAIRRASEAGFRVGGQLLPGLPGDTAEKSISSLYGVIDAGVSFIRVYPAIPLSGTELGRRYLSGEWQPLSLDEAVGLCARMLNISVRAGVDVIRIGLQSDEGLSMGETVLGGPWHPAIGQLVRGELYYALAVKIARNSPEPLYRISCNPSRVSDLSGHGGLILKRLQGIGIGVNNVHVDAGLETDEICFETMNHKFRCSVIKDLNDKEILDAQRIRGLS